MKYLKGKFEFLNDQQHMKRKDGDKIAQLISGFTLHCIKYIKMEPLLTLHVILDIKKLKGYL